MRVVSSSVISISMNSKNKKKQNGGGTGGPKIPRGLRGLSSVTSLAPSDGRVELSSLNEDIASIEQWWSTPRWQHTKRVYSGKELLVCSLYNSHYTRVSRCCSVGRRRVWHVNLLLNYC
jgi:hypothetical protein